MSGIQDVSRTGSIAAPQRVGGRRRARFVVGLTMMLVALIAPFGLSPASAHNGIQSLVYLDVTPEFLGGSVQMPFGDVAEVFDMVLLGTDDEVLAELGSKLPELQAYAQQHFSISVDGRELPLTFEGVELLGEDLWFGHNYVLLPFEVDFGGGSVPRVFDVTLDVMFDEIDGRTALLAVQNDWEAGVIENESDVLVSFDPDNRTRTVDLGDTGWWKTFSASIWLGVDHIRTGPDHIFFVLVLMLPAVLVYRTGWMPSPDAGSALWRVLKIATMFTLAHSITFSLAGLDILPLPPSRIVESVIAISIAAAAIHNIWPVAANKEWAIAFAFGLFHGMGFASLVSGIDVSRSTQLVSLLGRNVGIEFGQIAVILLVFGGLFLLSRTPAYRPFYVGSSVALAVIAFGWSIERLFQVDFHFTRFVVSAVEFPRVLLAIVPFTVACWGLYTLYKSRNELTAPAPA